MNYSKKAIIALVLTSSLVLQGCSKSTSEETTEQTLSTIDLSTTEATISELTTESTSESIESTSIETPGNQVYYEVDNNNQLFVISSDALVNSDLQGKILTYDCPENANVYRIQSYEPDYSFNNPISGWQRVYFQSGWILQCGQNYNDDMTDYVQLSHDEVNSIVDSTTRVEASEVEQFDVITSNLPDVTWSDYLISYTFPMITSDLYEITTWDEASQQDTTVDTVVDRTLYMYVVRPDLNGIPVGLPTDACSGYRDWATNSSDAFMISNDDWKMFYDGTNLYEVHDDYDNLEVYMENQTLLSLDQALNEASSIISELINDAQRDDMDLQIYSAELVYLLVREYDASAIDYNSEHITFDFTGDYLYPFWIINTHTNYISAGNVSASRIPIYVNAISGQAFK